MALQKIGYDGTWLFEVANTSTPRAVLEKTEKARRRFEELLDMSFENRQRDRTDDAPCALTHRTHRRTRRTSTSAPTHPS